MPPKRKISFEDEEKLVEEAPTDSQINEFFLNEKIKRKKRRQSAPAHVKCFVSLLNFTYYILFYQQQLLLCFLFK